jgi:hypothetical protein
MIATLSLPIDTALLAQLSAQVGNREGVRDVPEAISTAITFWLAAQAPDGVAEPPATRGYQWKSVFLPHGTELRCLSDGEYNYARVVGDQILHHGQILSPNQFAHAYARTTRNAWADLSVRRPGDKYFTSAKRLRRELAEHPMSPVPATQATPADPVSLLLAAVLSHAAAGSNPAPAAQPMQRPPAASQRSADPGNGWTLPERRTLRFRMEDVAY